MGSVGTFRLESVWKEGLQRREKVWWQTGFPYCHQTGVSVVDRGAAARPRNRPRCVRRSGYSNAVQSETDVWVGWTTKPKASAAVQPMSQLPPGALS